MSFAGKKAIVTGGASGIGRATVEALVARGAHVVAVDRDIDGAKRVAAADASARTDAAFVDLARPETIWELRDSYVAEHGAPDIIINAAGWDRIEPFMDNTPEFWADVVAINYLGPVHFTRAFLEPVIGAGARAKVVNLASDAGRVGSSGETVYAGTKGGVIAFTKSLAREMARHQINVNVVCPGPTDTPLFQNQPEKIKNALERAIPFRRLATPTEVASAVAFFASAEADFITGQVLSVSGGLTMAG
ncbi:SDR family oxidoreductase (plasmid) [Prescottella equi]|uniref:SDR family NAD(P)-dependent oxidoreductase n=1 Tax=Rhodococcus hoagii TaxID=43767 RepID=UPI0025763861|nr:SDR family oxidoreductase [Prescottella equi]WJJ14277.1 SDR family oxidoreductase [Prescottella equi]